MILRSKLGFFRAAAVTMFVALPACGPSDMDAPSNMSSDAKNGQAIDDVVNPPAEYHKSALDRQFQLLQNHSLYMAGAKSTLYVNFDGAVVQKGYGLGQSFIVCTKSATIPATDFSPADRQMIIDMVTEFFSKAGVALNVTQDEPTSGLFTTIHVGGSYGSLGCIDNPGILGVAPFDRGNMEPSDVGFAFTARVKSPKITAETIAHEAGHTYGLNHVDNRECLMFASNSAAIKGFGTGKIVGTGATQNAPMVLQTALGMGTATSTPSTGTSKPAIPAVPATPTPSAPIAGLPNLPDVLKGLPGLDQIASIGTLIPDLDPSKILDVSALTPQLGAILPGGAAAVPGLVDFDKLLTVIQLAAQAASNQAVKNGTAVPTNAGALAGILNPAAIANAGGGLAGLGALTGQGGLAAALAALQPLISGAAAAAPTKLATNSALPMGAVPDLSAVLAMGQFQDPAALVAMLRAHASVVNGNFSGPSQQALLSMLKVAYSQMYLRGFTK